jgi:prepilin-type N-terminal cleavage/methylation domain-containing protein
MNCLRRTASSGRGTERGFTIVEMLIGIGIMSVVFLAVTQILVRVHLSHATLSATSTLRQEGRVLLSRFGAEVRGAGHGLVGDLEAISFASTERLTIALDLDRGSPSRPCLAEAGDDGVEEITYRFVRGRIDRRLRCWASGAWTSEVPYTPVAEHVSAASFQYFDGDGLELLPGAGGLTSAEREQIVQVRINLVMVAEGRAIDGETTPSYQSHADVLVRNGAFLSRLLTGD